VGSARAVGPGTVEALGLERKGVRIGDDCLRQAAPPSFLDHRGRHVDADHDHAEAGGEREGVRAGSRPYLEVSAARLRVEQFDRPALVCRVERLFADLVEDVDPLGRIRLCVDSGEGVLVRSRLHDSEASAQREMHRAGGAFVRLPD